MVALLCLAAAATVDRLLPSPPRLAPPRRLFGVPPFAAGAVLGLSALVRFHHAGTTYEPFETPTVLVISGPYRYTRNPMYLGLLLILTSVGLLTGRLPLLLAPAIFFATINATQIPREERLMERQFGASYRKYTRQVRRWL